MRNLPSQKRIITKSQKPFCNILHFLNEYKPRTNFINMAKLRSTNQIGISQSKAGFYFGQMEDGNKNGQGVFFAFDGGIYEGNWSFDMKNNQGYEKDPKGVVYEGSWKNGQYHGNGTLRGIEQSYDGQWSNGKRNGIGTLRKNQGFSYIGQWRNNQFDGFGVMTLLNGDKYQGLFLNGKKNGKGVLKYGNGDIFKGYFSDDQFHGYGQFYEKNGNYFRGEYARGKKEGPGQLSQKIPKQKCYQGYFRDDMKWGYGVYSWSSGSCYKGFFQRDLQNGYGQMFWKDGSIYRGWWKDGVQHGKGELFVQKQGLMKGVFNNNRLSIMMQQKQISKSEYEKSIINNPQQGLPEGVGTKLQKKLNRNTPLSKSKSKSKSKTKTKSKSKNKQLRQFRTKKSNHKIQTKRIQFFRKKTKTQQGSLDTIEFPLLFKYHNRLKTMTSSFNDRKHDSEISNKQLNKRTIPITIDTENERQKNLHSALSIHKDFLSSAKNVRVTLPSNKTIYQKLGGLKS